VFSAHLKLEEGQIAGLRVILYFQVVCLIVEAELEARDWTLFEIFDTDDMVRRVLRVSHDGILADTGTWLLHYLSDLFFLF